MTTSAKTVSAKTDQGEAADDTGLFGRLVRGHRDRVGLTQRELADLSTISVRAIRDLEQGRATRPRHATVRLIADGLRLGPRARADLEAAARQGQNGWALKAGYDTAPTAPPAALDTLTGRESEAASLTAELASGTERLVNVMGLSGVGKTRLALEVAARLHSGSGFPVLWAAFAGPPVAYRTPSGPEGLAALVTGCAEALFGRPGERAPAAGAGEGTGRHADVTALAELVADRPALLVVDGAVTDRPDTDGIDRLLRDCPELRILVTSEGPYGIAGERTFLLGPLEAPDGTREYTPDSLGRIPAVRFFLDQLRRTRPEYVLTPDDVPAVADVCRRLDGLPAALRAAASWLVVYDLATLRQCLEDDLASLLVHLAGDDEGARFKEALRRRVARLPADGRALLARLCDGERGVRDGGFELADVAALTGRSLPECGRMVRDLLLSGTARPSYQLGRSRFQVFHLVRAFQPAVARVATVGGHR
ncbi:helix-turn-helix domain-containing protein [Streptomyces sp. NPDC059209]|uniref:helix-turn-helix domain-containing protein n=1 Tax=Streptomyces sp. NPDC059209 TaxID=3346769 RepID=UPI0036C6E444